MKLTNTCQRPQKNLGGREGSSDWGLYELQQIFGDAIVPSILCHVYMAAIVQHNERLTGSY